MNQQTLRIVVCLAVVLCAASLAPVRAGLRDNNLIEYSHGSYGNMSIKAMLWPPFVKIYQDGKVVHYDSEVKKFYLSRLDAQALDSLKSQCFVHVLLFKPPLKVSGQPVKVMGVLVYNFAP